MRRLLLAALVAAGCSDPTIAVSIVNRPPALERGSALTLSVVLLDDETIDCDDVRYGLINDDVLAGGRQASVSADGSGRITGVPRLGHKLFVLEGVDDLGRRIAGGCTAYEDITDDTPIEVRAEPSLRARLMSARDPGEPAVDGQELTVLVKAPWGELPEMAPDVLRVAIHDNSTATGTGTAAFKARDADDFVYQVTLDTPRLAVGPSQIVIRPSWADEPLIVPAFTKPAPLGGVRLGPVGGMPNRLPASWVVLTAPGQGDDVRAAAVSARAGAPQLVLAREQGAVMVPQARIDEPDLRAIVEWNGTIYTRLAPAPGPAPTPRWRALDWDTLTLNPIADQEGSAEAADEIHAITCGATAAGLLVRSGAGDYEAFRAPGTLALPDDGVQAVAGYINGVLAAGTADADVLAARCLTVLGVDRAVVIVRVEKDAGISTHVVVGGGLGIDLTVPATSGVTTYLADDRWLLVGGETGVEGPRLVGYKFVQFMIPMMPALLLLVPSELEHALAAPPSSIAVFTRDGFLNTVAAVTIDGRSRLQSTVLTSTAPPLTGLSDVTVGVDPRVVAVDLLEATAGGLPTRQLLILTSEGLTAIDPLTAATP